MIMKIQLMVLAKVQLESSRCLKKFCGAKRMVSNNHWMPSKKERNIIVYFANPGKATASD